MKKKRKPISKMTHKELLKEYHDLIFMQAFCREVGMSLETKKQRVTERMKRRMLL